MALLRRVNQLDPNLPVIIITGHGDVTLAVEAMRSGAYDFMQKPFSTADLVEVQVETVVRLDYPGGATLGCAGVAAHRVNLGDQGNF